MLTAIEAQITTHILTTSIGTCVFGFPRNVSAYPSAACAWRGGNVERVSGAGSLRDIALTLEVQIDGTDAAMVTLAAEELSALWYDPARFAQLSALGVVSILPAKLQPPLSSGDSVQTAKALVSFDVVVRVS